MIRLIAGKIIKLTEEAARWSRGNRMLPIDKNWKPGLETGFLAQGAQSQSEHTARLP
jgi:hypothetical protein